MHECMNTGWPVCFTVAEFNWKTHKYPSLNREKKPIEMEAKITGKSLNI